jgi:integrase
MPRRAKELTAIEVKRLKPGVHAVGGVAGLYLQVASPTARSWLLRVVVGTKRREIGLGPYPEIGLAQARQLAGEMKADVRVGIDPVEKRKEARSALEASNRKGLTFRDAVKLYVPIKARELAEGKYRDQWRNSLDKYAMPHLGDIRVHDVTLLDILSVLEPHWSTIPVTADKLRRKLNEILDFCTVRGHRTGLNPARWEGNLEHALGANRGRSDEDHYPALQSKDLPRLWRALAGRQGMGAAALRFQLLSATRVGAIRFMTWQEIDVENKVWTVQATRKSSKIGRKDGAKRVPLIEPLLEILKHVPRLEKNDLVFWAPRGGALSDATLGKLMNVLHEADVRAGNCGFLDAKTGEVAVPHGSRSTFKNWAIDQTSYEWQLSEAALWHKLGNKVETAYARSDMLEKRRQMMEDWARFVQGAAIVKD